MGFQNSTEDRETKTVSNSDQLAHQLQYGSTEWKQKQSHALEDLIGGIGTYQWGCSIPIGLCWLFFADIISINFLGGTQDHWCHVQTLSNLSHEHQKHIAIPYDQNGEYDKCRMYDLNYSQYDVEDFLKWNRSLMVNSNISVVDCTNGWTYDRSHYIFTIASRLDLVCGDQWMVSLISTIYIAGEVVGAYTSGFYSDRYGRKRALCGHVLLKLAATFMTVFPFHFSWVAITRFFLGIGATGSMLSGFILAIEQVSSNWRTRLGMIYNIDYSIGVLLWSAVAYFVRDDVRLQLAMACPQLLLISFFWFVEESPRWLLLKGRYKEAERIIAKIATVNNRHLPNDLDVTQMEESQLKMTNRKSKTYADILMSPSLRVRACVVDIYWFATSLTFYALSLNAETLVGNVFLNTALYGTVEIPAHMAATFFLNWRYTGRRITCVMALLLAAVTSLISIYMLVEDHATQNTILSMIVKAFVSGAFSGIFIYTSELFPTDVRNVGVGIASLCARLGGMMAPFIGGPLRAVWLPLPPLVCGAFAAVSGLLILSLPETLDKPLCNTIEEAEALGRPCEICRTERTKLVSPD